jgi:hypothetical protein
LEIKDIYLSSISWPFPFLTAFCAIALALWAVYFSILNFFIYEVLNKLAPYIGIQGWILGLMIVETILLPLMIPLYPTLFICGFYDPGPP